MDCIFSKFELYNFDSDARFQGGLRDVPKSNRSSDELLEMKLFFYNRFVEPIDGAAYLQWRSSSGPGAKSGHATPPTERHADTGGQSMSFVEVMKLVQGGKHVPGVKQLDIQPTNQSPAPSKMQRITKPWENTLHPT